MSTAPIGLEDRNKGERTPEHLPKQAEVGDETPNPLPDDDHSTGPREDGQDDAS